MTVTSRWAICERGKLGFVAAQSSASIHYVITLEAIIAYRVNAGAGTV